MCERIQPRNSTRACRLVACAYADKNEVNDRAVECGESIWTEGLKIHLSNTAREQRHFAMLSALVVRRGREKTTER